MRVVFMGTPAFAVPTLMALHEAGHDVAAVYSQPPRPAGRGQKETPSPVHQYASQHKLPVFTPVSLKTPEAQEQFAAHKAEIAVVAAYGLLLPMPILEAYPLGCINVHPSSLPRWRGAAPIQRTIMAGDKETVICIMQMDAGLDTGNILLKSKRYDIQGMTAGELHDLLASDAGPLVLATLEGLKNRTITPAPQAEEGVTYAKKITREECRLDWNKPARALYHQILGLSPAPGAYFTYSNEMIKVFDAKPEERSASASAGTTMDDQLSVACGAGTLQLLTLQRSGKKRMSAEELLRGHPIPTGTVLE